VVLPSPAMRRLIGRGQARPSGAFLARESRYFAVSEPSAMLRPASQNRSNSAKVSQT
jgi:hypothetical protein